MGVLAPLCRECLTEPHPCALPQAQWSAACGLCLSCPLCPTPRPLCLPLCSASATFPLDLVRRRMQLEGAGGRGRPVGEQGRQQGSAPGGGGFLLSKPSAGGLWQCSLTLFAQRASGGSIEGLFPNTGRWSLASALPS